jgi:hypothetical protein
MKTLARPSPSKQLKLTSTMIVRKEPSEKAAITAATASGSKTKYNDVALETNEATPQKKYVVVNFHCRESYRGPTSSWETNKRGTIRKKLTLSDPREEILARGLQTNKNLCQEPRQISCTF